MDAAAVPSLYQAADAHPDATDGAAEDGTVSVTG